MKELNTFIIIDKYTNKDLNFVISTNLKCIFIMLQADLKYIYFFVTLNIIIKIIFNLNHDKNILTYTKLK